MRAVIVVFRMRPYRYLATMLFLLFLALMLMVGNLLADVALAWIDPRIRYQ